MREIKLSWDCGNCEYRQRKKLSSGPHTQSFNYKNSTRFSVCTWNVIKLVFTYGSITNVQQVCIRKASLIIPILLTCRNIPWEIVGASVYVSKIGMFRKLISEIFKCCTKQDLILQYKEYVTIVRKALIEIVQC